MNYNFYYHCITLLKASNNITKVYDTVPAKVELNFIQFSTLRNIQKLGKINFCDLSYLLVLDRTTVLRNIEKLI